MEKRINRSINLFPFYYGFTADLLFYIAIDTLFLSLVKNFTAAEIVSLTSLSQLLSIALQVPILYVIKKIGNTASVRSGALFLLLSALFITFGKTYLLVLIGRFFHDVAVIIRNASIVALENNLDLVDRKGDFIKIRTSANTVYAVITMLISFVASYMFTLNNYLPMYGCIATCSIGLMITLFMKDYSPYNKALPNKTKKARTKIQYNKLLIITIILYALFYSVVTSGQNEGKLFIQQNVLLDFDVDTTALIIGAVVCVSRIIRVISNLVFVKLYKKFRDKMGVLLPVLLSSSIAFMLFGSLIPEIITKIVIMALGYTIILFIRDPFYIYVQDVVFENTPKEQHQTLLTILTFGTKLVTAGLGLAFSAILVGQPMIVVIAILFGISISGILLSLKVYREVMIGKREKALVVE